MQEHVELEVALEIVMARVAQAVTDLQKETDGCEKKKKEEKLQQLMELQEKAYQGDRKAIREILEKKEEAK